MCASLRIIQWVITFKLERLVTSVTCLSMDWLRRVIEELVEDLHTLYGKQQPRTVSYVDWDQQLGFTCDYI